DVVLLGTDLPSSILAAALAKAGYKVIHVDPNDYYGGDHATLNVDEIISWANLRSASVRNESANEYLAGQRNRFISVSCYGSPPPASRQYSLSLIPSIIPSVGPLISTLINSGVSRYGGLKLLEKVALYRSPGRVQSVPNTKEDVFNNKRVSLIDKRRLMRFFTFVSGDFEDKPELHDKESASFIDFLTSTFTLERTIAETIVFALAFCSSPQEPTLPALKRVRHYLRSSGRYGPSPFLVGHYGGLGELVQGFCRVSAVNGSTYVLSHSTSSTSARSLASRRYSVSLTGLGEAIDCDLLLSSIEPPGPGSAGVTTAVARCIAIINEPLILVPQEVATPEESLQPTATAVDTALVVFPPSVLPGGSETTAAHVYVTGEGSMSAPKGNWILYLSIPLDDSGVLPETMLQPYLEATLTLVQGDQPIKPIFSLFYTQLEHGTPSVREDRWLVPQITTLISECADSAAVVAEKMFRETVRVLDDLRRDRGEEVGEEPIPFWPPLEDEDSNDE
ncbi:FAD/NAD(P)-binding domain-containing protein, partial [Thelephora ganbajun]